ncbi:MAG: translation initiation factor IF-2 [Candidatus Electrothrix sp. GW3-4]|uniref:translation initiation factor IF-2 n=1 Tax=Candidatus Electrothrix sp. GW3-4 TaxID=3126740 RepID=UPI0030D62545
MSRVRIYELAKEAGLKSKELADKLIAMGYPIKSLSSTVDDDMAADIRRKVLGKATAEVTEKPIGMKKQTAVVRKKKNATVVRRRSKALKDEIAKKAEAKEQDGKDKVRAALKDEVPATADTVSQPLETEAERPAQQQAVEDTMDAAAKGDGKEGKAGTAEVAVQKNNETSIQKKTSPKKEVKRAKGLAKIVGRVELNLEDTEKPAPRRTPRPARGARKGGQAEVDPAVQNPASAASRGKDRKKNKRVVAIESEKESRAKKTSKPARKGRQRVDFSLGGGEYTPYRGRRKKDKRRKSKISSTPVTESKAIKRRIKVFESINVGDLAKRMGIKANEVIAKLMGLGVMATLNQALDLDTATLVAADFGYEVEQGMTEELGVEALQEGEKGGEKLPRFPVVTVMGHVDHGKTSILDAIRRTDVAEGEAGGITQHIGAYHVQAPSGDITFVDTPGHAAFTEMRSRGAKVTDIVVLVVAADDGVMNQTKEAIAHAKAAEVPIVVAINKIDKDNADPSRVIRELGDFGLIPEDWGGDTIFCETSAKKGLGIEALLENVQLQAEVLELTADPNRKAQGTVIEAQLHKGRGSVATVLVQEGTLRTGEYFIAGQYSGKVRSLINDRGEQVDEAGPSLPVEVQGLSGVPQAGDEFLVVTDEKMAKSVSDARQLKVRESELASASKVSLDNLFEKMAEQEMKELRVVLRSDVQGTLQAFGQAAEKLSTDVIRVRVLHEGTGAVTENDIHLASASDAIIIGFNVRPSVKVKELAEQEQVDIRTYDVIYHALEDIEKAMVGMLEPEYEERVIGTAEVRDTFSVPKIGTIAGCFVIDGKIERNAGIRVLRDSVVIYTGVISSLRRFKDDVKEVATGYECGIGVENYNDIKVGDTLEAFLMDEVEATL